MHDQNFKNLILDYPHAALTFFAGAEAQGMAMAKIVPIRQEQLKERLGERFRELDSAMPRSGFIANSILANEVKSWVWHRY